MSGRGGREHRFERLEVRGRRSPTSTSGPCAHAVASASATSNVSVPTSRWLMIDCLSAWRYSTGSSIVTMCAARFSLMWSMSAFIVVVLPQPAGPVTSTRPAPFGRDALDTGGSPSWSQAGMPCITRRKTRASEPRWRYTWTRNRPTPETLEREVDLAPLGSSSSARWAADDLLGERRL